MDARFLLTHLSDPAAMVAAFHRTLRYHDLYCSVVRRARRRSEHRPAPAVAAAAERLHGRAGPHRATVALNGEPKLINGLTMENVAGPVIEDGLATRGEIDEIVQELYAFAADPATLAGVPRIVQAWGKRS